MAVYQDDKAKKLEGVRSLIKYATLCDYMLVPTEEERLKGLAADYPELIPGYGSRGWWCAALPSGHPQTAPPSRSCACVP